jgi:hypothetical protein
MWRIAFAITLLFMAAAVTVPVEGESLRGDGQEHQGKVEEKNTNRALDLHIEGYSSGSPATYTNPCVKGPSVDYHCNDRLDWCVWWGGNKCGQEVADEFCRMQGHDSAYSFEQDYDIPRTRLIGDDRVCTRSSTQRCDGFKEITCLERRPLPTADPKTFWYPKLLDGMPLDYCYSREKWCGGQYAADSFCRMNGYDKAKTYEKVESSLRTKQMIGGYICDPAQMTCHTYRRITCELRFCL